MKNRIGERGFIRVVVVSSVVKRLEIQRLAFFAGLDRFSGF